MPKKVYTGIAVLIQKVGPVRLQILQSWTNQIAYECWKISLYPALQRSNLLPFFLNLIRGRRFQFGISICQKLKTPMPPPRKLFVNVNYYSCNHIWSLSMDIETPQRKRKIPKLMYNRQLCWMLTRNNPTINVKTSPYNRILPDKQEICFSSWCLTWLTRIFFSLGSIGLTSLESC